MNAYSGSQKIFDSDRNQGDDDELVFDYNNESSYYIKPSDKRLFQNGQERLSTVCSQSENSQNSEKPGSKSEAKLKQTQAVKQLYEYSKKIQERIALSNKAMETNIQAASQELKSQQQSLEDFNTTLQGTVSMISSQIEAMNSKIQGMKETYTERFQQLNDCFDTITQTLSMYDTQ